ncbi:MAG: phospholipid carrier-dependent glycosyltransferase [Isosphaeraceae bacterium]
MEKAPGGRTPQVRPHPRLKIILVALLLCRGLVLLCVIPPFEGWDEFQHVAYIVHLSETGERPILGETIVPRSLDSRLSSFPHGPYALKMLRRTGAVDYATFWERPIAVAPKGGKPPESTQLSLYQAQHGPFYYSLAVPLFALAGGVGDLRMSVGVLRLFNLLLTAASVWIALGVVERLIRDPALCALCGLLIATQPLFLINGVRVANDALGVFLATAAVAAALDRRTFRSRASMFALGLLVGLGTLAKSVHFGLIPFVSICALAAHFPDRLSRATGRGWFPALRATCLILAGFLVVTLAEFHANLVRYDSLTVMQESVQNRRSGRGMTDLVHAAGSVRWVKWTRNIWLRKNVMAGGWSWAGDNNRMQDRHELLLSLALAGWAWTLRRRHRARVVAAFAERRGPLLCLALCASYSAALAYHTVQSQLAWGMPTTNPWYAAAALPSFLLLVAGGAYVWPVGRLRFVLPLLIALFYLQTESSMVLGSMTSLYTAQAEWTRALARLAFLQPAVFGTPTLHAAIIGVVVVSALAMREVVRSIAFDYRVEPAKPSRSPAKKRADRSRRRAVPVFSSGSGSGGHAEIPLAGA